MGLSPRVRGNLTLVPMELVLMGSIPARAGEPTEPSDAICNHRVYPRACGGTISSTSRSTK